MKKIIAVLLAFATIFSLGCFGGIKYAESAVKKTNSNVDNIPTQIAVVNLDEGTTNAVGEFVYYSDVFLRMLGTNYCVESANGAVSGMEDNRYSAIITFPSDMSDKVESLNTSDPSQVMVEYTINPRLSQENYISTASFISSFQSAIRSNLSYLYTNSLIEQLHKAQTDIDSFLSNNAAVLDELQNINSLDYIDNLNFSMMPTIALDLSSISPDEYFTQTQQLTSQLSIVYEAAYQAEYDRINTEMADLEERISDFKDWNQVLNTYVSEIDGANDELQVRIEAYYKALETYSNDVIGYTDENGVFCPGILNLLIENKLYLDEYYVQYRQDLSQYSTSLGSDAEAYRNDLLDYSSILSGYASDIKDYEAVLTSNYNTDETNLKSTADTMQGYCDELNGWFGIICDYQSGFFDFEKDIINNVLKDYQENLDDCYDELRTDFENLQHFYTALDKWYDDLNAYRDSIIDWQNGVSDDVEKVDTFLSYLPTGADDYNFWLHIQYFINNCDTESHASENSANNFLIARILTDGQSGATYGCNFSFANTDEQQNYFRNDNHSIANMQLALDQIVAPPADVPTFAASQANANLGYTIDPSSFALTADDPSNISAPSSDVFSYSYSNGVYDNDEVENMYFYSPTLDQRFSPNDTIFGIDFDPTKPPQEPDLTDMPTAPELPQWQGAPDFNSNGNYTFTQNITVPDFADVYPEYAEFPQYKENRPEVPGDPGDLSGYVNQYLSVIGYLSPATYLQATSNRYTGQINGIMAQYSLVNSGMSSDFLSNQSSNISELQSAYGTYSNYVSTMKNEFSTTYNAENEALETTVNTYSENVQALNSDNIALLGDFTSLMPNTWNGSSVNTNVVNAMVDPIEFVNSSEIVTKTATSFSKVQTGLIYVAGITGVLAMAFAIWAIIDTKRKMA